MVGKVKIPKKILPAEKVFICVECARHRGFRAPLPDEGPVETTVAKCQYCEAWTVLANLGHLKPAWE